MNGVYLLGDIFGDLIKKKEEEKDVDVWIRDKETNGWNGFTGEEAIKALMPDLSAEEQIEEVNRELRKVAQDAVERRPYMEQDFAVPDTIVDIAEQPIPGKPIDGVEPIIPGEPDNVYHPSHYTQYKAMEPFTFFMLNNIPFAESCVCKYVLRWRQKNGIEDLNKAKRIIEMMIELETNRDRYLPEKRSL